MPKPPLRLQPALLAILSDSAPRSAWSDIFELPSQDAIFTEPSQAQFPVRCRTTSATIARLRKEIAARHVIVETLAKRFYVSGAVQGVGFRFFAERRAAQLGVAGYVKNLFDGRVEVYAIGSAAQLDTLKSELRRGPRMASVDQVTESDSEILPEFSNGFSIESDY